MATTRNDNGRNPAENAAILHIFNKTKCVNPVSNIADAVRKYRVRAARFRDVFRKHGMATGVRT
jgi:hypothetical protein